TSLTNRSQVVDASRAFLAAYADVFGISPKSLLLERADTGGQLWFIGYRQVHNGVPIVGAEIGLTITREGRLVAAGARTFPEVEVEISPAVSAESAAQVARSRMGLSNADQPVPAELVVVPVDSGDRYEYSLAWRVRMDQFTSERAESKTYLIDAIDQSVIAEYDNVLDHAHVHAQSWHAPFVFAASGDPFGRLRPIATHALENTPAETHLSSGSNSLWGYVKLNYYETPDDYTYPLNRHTDQPFAGAKVTVTNNATMASQTTYADESGYYIVSGLSSGSHMVKFEIANDMAYVESGVSSSKKAKSFSVNVSGSTRKDYDWNWGDDGDGGLTSYALNGVYHIRDMNGYFYDVYGFDALDDWEFKVRVQSASQGQTGPGGGSTFIVYLGGAEAMSSEVTLHEFSRDAIYRLYGDVYIRTGQSGREYQESAAMDEGFSDYFTADYTNHQMFGGPEADADPNTPPGDGVAVRYLWNTCTMSDFDGSWPCGGSEHSRGRIIGGAVWRVRTAIGTEASHLLYTALQIQPYAHTFEEFRDRYAAALSVPAGASASFSLLSSGNAA